MQLCNRSIREHQTQWNVIQYGALLCIGVGIHRAGRHFWRRFDTFTCPADSLVGAGLSVVIGPKKSNVRNCSSCSLANRPQD